MSTIIQHCVRWISPFSIYSSKYSESSAFLIHQNCYYLSLEQILFENSDENDFILNLRIYKVENSHISRPFPIRIFIEDESNNIQFLQTAVANEEDMRKRNGQIIWSIKARDIDAISKSSNRSNLKIFLLCGEEFTWINNLKTKSDTQIEQNREDKFVRASSAAKQTDNKMVQTAFESKKIDCLEKLSLDFSNLLYSENETDITIICGKINFAAHKSILAARSEVFAAMFRNDMSEKFSSCVEINDIDPAIMKIVLQYVYSGTLPELTEDTALVLYTVAHKYAIAVLQRRCADFLMENLTESNACRNLLLVDRHNDDDFKRYVIEFIIKNAKILSEDAWLQICDENPQLSIEVYQEHVKYLSTNRKE